MICHEKGLGGRKPDRWRTKDGGKLINEYFILHIYWCITYSQSWLNSRVRDQRRQWLTCRFLSEPWLCHLNCETLFKFPQCGFFFSSIALILRKHLRQYVSCSKLLISLLVVGIWKSSYSQIASQVSNCCPICKGIRSTWYFPFVSTMLCFTPSGWWMHVGFPCFSWPSD